MAQHTLAPPAHMDAIVQDRYGTADVLHLDRVPVPEPRKGEVLVQVAAAGLDRGTWHLMTGLPLLVRLLFGIRRPRQPIPGFDLAGTVVAVGDGVDRWTPGDEVFGIGMGAFAPYARARADKLALRPEGIPAETAAVVAISGLTGLQAVRDQARIQPGQRVLILGASGGVGSYAVQIARRAGAHVTGVASTSKLDMVTGLGADRVLDYTTDDVLGDDRYDAIIDTGGTHPLRRLRRALAERGTLVIVGGEGGGRLLGGVDRQARARLWSPFVSQRLTAFISEESGEDIRELADMLADGRLMPAVDEVVPLAEAPGAMRRMEAGTIRGKIAIAIG